MSKWKPTPLRRSLKPVAEGLETRQLLSATGRQQVPKGVPTQAATAVVRGMDPDGAQWTLSLYGPGALNVVGTDGDVFTRQTGTLQESIDTITVAGAITTSTRLVARVYPDPTTGNAKVYFQNLVVTPTGELGKIDEGQVSNFRTVANGILAIDMPDFYLAHTETTKPSVASQIHTSAMSAGEIYIPQGVLTLRFGGVDVDYVPPGGVALNTTGQSNEFQISLGLPVVQGTSIIVNTVNSDAEVNSTSGSPPFQDYATFLVTGRLNLFQANEIDGNTTAGLVPTQLVNSPSSTGASPGGTFVISQGGAATGQIGDVRVGGSATNFTTFVTEDPLNVAAAEGQLDAKISNYYIGGQTQNVLLVAPSGARNVSFGLGMDNMTISANAIDSLAGQPRCSQLHSHREPIDPEPLDRRRCPEHQRERWRGAEPLHVRQLASDQPVRLWQRRLLRRAGANGRQSRREFAHGPVRAHRPERRDDAGANCRQRDQLDLLGIRPARPDGPDRHRLRHQGRLDPAPRRHQRQG